VPIRTGKWTIIDWDIENQKKKEGGYVINIGVIGYGYWGPNIVRNFNSAEDAQVSAVCDRRPDVLGKVKKLYPNIEVYDDCCEIIKSPDIDAVAVVTPVTTHYELAKSALENGKHVFVEKPFTATAREGEELIELAEQKGKMIMVDHTFIFTGAVRRMKQMIDDGILGDIYYYDSTRVNLGLIQHDVNVIWDLAPHDFSIMDYLLEEKPTAIQACGKAHVNGKEDIAYVTVHFEKNLLAHFNVNWLSPVKVRTTLIGGKKKMLVWNDVNADEKIKLYDKGIDVGGREGIYNLMVSYRTGDMWAPKVDQKEALALEADYFVDCMVQGKRPINDGHAGLNVVKMLEACDKSINRGGAVTEI